MKSDRIARYIDALTHALRSRGVFDRSLLKEVRDHLVDAVEDGVQRGAPADVAEREAISRFGRPDVVAEHAAAGVSQWRRRALLALCAVTMLASAYLSLSMLILRPPRANYPGWFVEAALFVAQGALTIVALTRGGSPTTWSRSLLTAGGVAIALIGGSSLYAAATAHFEGYALVLGALLNIQGLVTIVHFQRRRIRIAARTSS